MKSNDMLLDSFVYGLENHVSPSVEELEKLLNHYYQHRYEEQQGILPTRNDNNIFRKQNIFTNITDVKEYFESHKVWKPSISSNVFPEGKERDTNTIQDLKEYDSFINHVHVPKTIGKEPIPSFVHHTSCSINGFIYILGGGYKFSRESSADLINTDNIKINYKKLPFPIDNEILNHPALIPNQHLYILSTDSTNISKVQVNGDIPPPLFCVTSSQITKRHIFYYGGFQFIDKITKNDNGDKFIIDRDIQLNNSGYILDILTLKFKKFELIAHPTILSKSPVTVPRFGHSSASLNIHKCLYDTEETIPATVFIMGGYKKTSTGEFETIADLWKVEFSTTYKGKHNYLEFGENLLATPINNILDTGIIFPKKRAFHITEFIDTVDTFGDHQPKSPYENSQKVGIARPSSPDSMNSYNIDESRKLNKKLVLHGGTSKNDILGDTWWFDLDDEVWTQVDTYCLKYETDKEKILFGNETFKCHAKNVSHNSIIIDKYMVLFLGAIPASFKDHINQNEDEIPDISDLVYKISENKENSSLNRLLCLNLVTQTWILLRCYHTLQFNPNKNGSALSCVGCSIVGSYSKVISTGGYLKPIIEISPEIEEVRLLSGGLFVFEFPFGTSTNYSIRRI